MSILYAEGFDDGVLRGATGGNVAPTIQSTVARTGTRSLRAQTAGSGQTSHYTVTIANTVTGFASFAFNTSFPPSASLIIALLLDTGTVHLDLRLRSDLKFEVTRNGTALTGGVGSFVYALGSHVHIAIKWTINDSTGVAEVRLNGSTSPDINVTGADTRNGANASANQVRVGQNSSGINTTNSPFYFDDLVIQDDQGSSPENTWLGDVECAYLFPNAAGDEADWAVAGSSPAATTHESLDEVPPDDLVTLVESSTVGDKYLVNLGALPGTSAAIYAVVGIVRAWKASAGAREIKQLAKLGTTEVQGAAHVLSTSILDYANIWHRDPDTNAWTESNVNALQIGAEVTV